MDTLRQDVRYCFRGLARNPGFTIIVVLTLAVGIGVNTALFTIINAVLLRPLPFNKPEKIVEISRAGLLVKIAPDSPENFLDWKVPVQSIEDVAAYYEGSASLTTGIGYPYRADVMPVTSSFFHVLGVGPMIGRGFTRSEERTGANRVAVLSYGLWRQKFGDDLNVTGKSFEINGQNFIVIGVMPSSFQFSTYNGKAEIWIPLTYGDNFLATEGIAYNVIGRVKDNISLIRSQQEMNLIFRQLSQTDPQLVAADSIILTPVNDHLTKGIRPALMILFGAVGLVLLIACANVSNLLLARAISRRKEVAIRMALGASRWRLIRQWLTESLFLSLLAGLLGLVVNFWAAGTFVSLSPVHIPRTDEITIDIRVLVFTAALSLLTAIFFAFAPALQFSKITLVVGLNDSGKGSIGRGGQDILRRSLILIEVGLSIVLLVGAGLLLKSFLRVWEIDAGFDSRNVLTLELSPSKSRYPTANQRALFYQQEIESLARVPGVQRAGAIDQLPLGSTHGSMIYPVSIEGRPTTTRISGGLRVVSPDYFLAMGIPLLRGRYLSDQDSQQGQQVVLLNEAFSRTYFPFEDPVGKQLTIGRQKTTYVIVGVVGNVKQRSLESRTEEEFYLSYLQHPSPFMSVVIRTDIEPLNIISSLRQEIWKVDKDQPVYNIKTMEQARSESLSERRFSAVMLTAFAMIAILLAAVGIFGVMSFWVNQRTPEIGIRMALGASSTSVLRLVVWQGMSFVLIGTAIGLGVSALMTRFLSTMLYGVSTTDPSTYAEITILLIVVATIGCYVPARRAAGLRPAIALRRE